MCPSSNTHTPQPCSPGRYSKGGLAQCDLCPAGTLNTIQGATGCCPCAPGCFSVCAFHPYINSNAQILFFRARWGPPTVKSKLPSAACFTSVSSPQTIAVPGTSPIQALGPHSMSSARRREVMLQYPTAVQGEMGFVVRNHFVPHCLQSLFYGSLGSNRLNQP
jgi:hypothetical protein